MELREPSLLAQNKTLAFTIFPTYEEYLHQSSPVALRLRQRSSEVRLAPEDQSYFSTYPDFLHFVALISEDAPDSWIVLSVWARIVQSCPRFALRLATEEGSLAPLAMLMDESDPTTLLEEQEFPILYIFDEEWNLQAQWGPHPQTFDSFLDSWLNEHSDYERLTESDDPADIADYAVLAEKLACEMRIWYNNALNDDCVSEIRTLLAGLNDDASEVESTSPDQESGNENDEENEV